VSPAQASLPRSWPTPELRIPNAAAQTRIVSKARIRLDSRKSVRSCKGIICVDISEFESYMPSHAVGLSQVRSPAIVSTEWSSGSASSATTVETRQRPLEWQKSVFNLVLRSIRQLGINGR
jgi:hypothetical protein